ncbi:hypothetical protein EVAR_26763_1 [Eumeta japonica]|uniref:Uncharacterized protein n=1 Tax=Eumeta variegata TaxID=151549 RepID=A0A4C1XF92_EUMVA|nr:hypothetical protein EVAR_26763_1 [Eumeta japonica]
MYRLGASPPAPVSSLITQCGRSDASRGANDGTSRAKARKISEFMIDALRIITRRIFVRAAASSRSEEDYVSSTLKFLVGPPSPAPNANGRSLR